MVPSLTVSFYHNTATFELLRTLLPCYSRLEENRARCRANEVAVVIRPVIDKAASTEGTYTSTLYMKIVPYCTKALFYEHVQA